MNLSFLDCVCIGELKCLRYLLSPVVSHHFIFPNPLHIFSSQVLGTDDLFDYLDKYDLELDPNVESIMSSYSKKPWNRFVTPDNVHLASEDAMKFLDGLLQYDHHKRLTAAEAMQHAYFAPVRAAEAQKRA